MAEQFEDDYYDEEDDDYYDEDEDDYEGMDLLFSMYASEGYSFGGRHVLQFHRRILYQDYGYELESLIASNQSDPFDNQVWKIVNINHQVVQALKVCHLKYKFEWDLRSSLLGLYREAETMWPLNHPNILRITHVFGLQEPYSAFEYSYHCMVMDMMEGTLKGLLERYPNEVMPEYSCHRWFVQMAWALDYLHNGLPNGQSISHLALRPVNILYRTDPETSEYLFKLADFEEAQVYYRGEPNVFPDNRGLGINGWSAREIRHREFVGMATRPMDVYSLGHTLMTSLLTEFAGTHSRWCYYVLKKIPEDQPLTAFERDLFCHLSPDLEDLLLSTNHPKQTERPTIQQVLNHQWVRHLMDQYGGGGNGGQGGQY